MVTGVFSCEIFLLCLLLLFFFKYLFQVDLLLNAFEGTTVDIENLSYLEHILKHLLYYSVLLMPGYCIKFLKILRLTVLVRRIILLTRWSLSLSLPQFIHGLLYLDLISYFCHSCFKLFVSIITLFATSLNYISTSFIGGFLIWYNLNADPNISILICYYIIMICGFLVTLSPQQKFYCIITFSIFPDSFLFLDI